VFAVFCNDQISSFIWLRRSIVGLTVERSFIGVLMPSQ
jgi:hypothetical protein